MVFKRKNYSTTTEILDLIKADDEIMRSTAVFYFHRKDKVSGKIYFRKGVEPGLVYAAHVSNMPFKIGKRIKPLIDPEDYDEILRQVGGDDTDPNIARLAVSKQLVSEKIVDSFIREYLFSAAAEIFSWQEVIGTWEIGTETRDFASRHYIGLNLLQKKAADRDEQYASMIADTKLPEGAIENLKVLRRGSIEDFADIENRNLQSIIEFADGRHTVAGIRDETGLLKIPAFLGIHALWSAGRIQLLAGDIPVYPPSAIPEEPEKAKNSEDLSEPIEFDNAETHDDVIKGELVEEEDDDEINESDEEIPSFSEMERSFEEEPSEEESFEDQEVSDSEEGESPINTQYEASEDSFDTDLPGMQFFDEPDDIEDFPEPVKHVKEQQQEEEKVIMEENIAQVPVVGNSIFDKLYSRIETLQKEVASSDANIKQSEMAVRTINSEIEKVEEELQRLKSDRSEAMNKYREVVAQGKDSKEKLEKIIASIDSLTAG